MSHPSLERVLVILNPAAGRGVAPAAWARAEPVLRGAGVETHLVTTEAPGHATEIARRAAEDTGAWSAVLAVGGDGTLQEVAAGLLAALSPLPLAVLPAGSGNDFVKPLGIPTAPESAARHLLNAHPVQVDAGRANGRVFVNGVGIGFDARIAIEARKIRRLRGTALYAWALLRALGTHRPWWVRVDADGERVQEGLVTLVTVTNGPCHGGGFWLCPDARVADGRLDVLVAGALPRRGVLAFLARTLKGAHVGRPGIRLETAQRVVLESETPIPVHADGEIVDAAATRVEVEVLPGALTVLAGPLPEAGPASASGAAATPRPAGGAPRT